MGGGRGGRGGDGGGNVPVGGCTKNDCQHHHFSVVAVAVAVVVVVVVIDGVVAVIVVVVFTLNSLAWRGKKLEWINNANERRRFTCYTIDNML